MNAPFPSPAAGQFGRRQRRERGPRIPVTIVTGFLGAYTTFSTFSLDTYRLLEEGHAAQAGLNAFGTLAAGLVAVWLGLKVGRAV